jgi:acetylornithine/succinyldiaminopimelate/putrescine aminotransferase
MNRADLKCPYSKFAFLNSGSEGMEFALRVSDINNKNNSLKQSAYIVLKNGFHGRTTSASILSDSTRDCYEKNLRSFMRDKPVFTVMLNNTEHLHKKFISLKNEYEIDSIVIEPVMGEGNPGEMVSKDFYSLARKLTKEHGSNLIVDSVQAGIRTNGYLSVVDYPNLKNEEAPDMEVFSKAINAGQYPLSVIAVNNKVADTFKTGIYGNTMTGNPKALEIGIETLNRLTPELIKHIQIQGVKFKMMLEYVKKNYPFIVISVSGKGLLTALHINEQILVVNENMGLEYLCRKNGLNVIHGGKNALRFTPRFDITDDEIKLIQKILMFTFEEYTNKIIRNIN